MAKPLDQLIPGLFGGSLSTTISQTTTDSSRQQVLAAKTQLLARDIETAPQAPEGHLDDAATALAVGPLALPTVWVIAVASVVGLWLHWPRASEALTPRGGA